MTKAALRLFIRVIKRRIDSGEELEDILDSYPNLSEEEKELIREAISNG
jgi:uncharacterized protein (DUF433 family)